MMNNDGPMRVSKDETISMVAHLQLVQIKEDEMQKLRAALDALRGRNRLYAGWPDMCHAGRTDKELLKMADEALGDVT